eukprot:TRINITY_DN64449_c0_g1_i1.p1 TRINITY_DN64449_c0_g1~~TRINITY_DN64449_c0_g1_i1.p1  ORF type:complete len:185 (-),score=17.90 TRINITY_DN64449_c0_g1_i1:449-1003(-)
MSASVLEEARILIERRFAKCQVQRPKIYALDLLIRGRDENHLEHQHAPGGVEIIGGFQSTHPLMLVPAEDISQSPITPAEEEEQEFCSCFLNTRALKMSTSTARTAPQMLIFMPTISTAVTKPLRMRSLIFKAQRTLHVASLSAPTKTFPQMSYSFLAISELRTLIQTVPRDSEPLQSHGHRYT